MMMPFGHKPDGNDADETSGAGFNGSRHAAAPLPRSSKEADWARRQSANIVAAGHQTQNKLAPLSARRWPRNRE